MTPRHANRYGQPDNRTARQQYADDMRESEHYEADVAAMHTTVRPTDFLPTRADLAYEAWQDRNDHRFDPWEDHQ